MNSSKKIYIGAIILIVLTTLFYLLIMLGAIDASYELYSKISTALSFILIIFLLLSRSANVIANKQNPLIGYIGLIFGLIDIILLIIFFIIENDSILKFYDFMTAISTYLLIIMMIFEIQPSHRSHSFFQKVLTALITITCIFPYITGLKTINNTQTNSTLNNYNYNYNYMYNNISNYTNNSKFKSYVAKTKAYTVMFIISLIGFIINPMLRIVYSDDDYSNVQDIDNILNNTNRYKPIGPVLPPTQQINNQIPNQQSIQQPITNVIPNQQAVQQPTVQEVINEIPQEKVINPTFNRNDLPEAIIPSIDSTPIPNLDQQQAPQSTQNSQPINQQTNNSPTNPI